MTTLTLSPLPLIRYGRTSKDGERDAVDNTSRREQDRETITIAKRYDLPTFAEMVFDNDVSGSTFDRPGWEWAIGEIKAGRAGGIIAYDLKRMSRNRTAETLMMIADVEDVGGRLYDQSGPLSVEDADAEMMTTMKAMIARRDWREKQEYLRKSVRDAIERGVHVACPFGYQRSEGRDGVRKGTPLEINPAESPTVELAFELRRDGLGWVAIAMRLNAEGHPPRGNAPPKKPGSKRKISNGPPRWTHKTVRQMIMNDVYTGVARKGTMRNESAHPAIVTRELYEAANRSRGTKHAGPTEGYLLTGLVRCESCGYVMSHRTTSRKARYYECRNHGKCLAPVSVKADELERWVDEQMVEAIREIRAFQPTLDNAGLLAAEARAAEAERNLAGAFAAKAGMGELSKAEQRIVEAQIDTFRAALKAAEDDVERERNAVRGIDLPVGLTGDGYLDQPVPEKRHLLGLVFAGAATWKAGSRGQSIDERVRLVWRDETSDREIIPFVAGLDRVPAVAGVAAS